MLNHETLIHIAPITFFENLPAHLGYLFSTYHVISAYNKKHFEGCFVSDGICSCRRLWHLVFEYIGKTCRDVKVIFKSAEYSVEMHEPRHATLHLTMLSNVYIARLNETFIRVTLASFAPIFYHFLPHTTKYGVLFYH